MKHCIVLLFFVIMNEIYIELFNECHEGIFNLFQELAAENNLQRIRK